MIKRFLIVAAATCAMANTASADPILYNYNLNTDSGAVTGTFIGDFDLGNNAPVSVFTLTFNGVVFDLGAVIQRIAFGATDITGLSSTLTGGITLTSSTVAGATLDVNTCSAIACFARWTNIPGVEDGRYNTGQQRNAVTRATRVSEPTTLALIGFGLAGIGLARRRRRV